MRDLRDLGSISGLGRSPEATHGNPLQYSCLENHKDREAWWATVHRVPRSWTWRKWLRQHIKKQRRYFANKGPSSQGYGFSSSHVWMWELDYKESWTPKNWCFWTVVLEKTLECPLDSKEIQPVNPKGNQSRIFIRRTDVEAETPILWPSDAKNWFIFKDPDAGKDWRWEEKGMTENEIVGWHHWLDGREPEWTPGDGDGQGGLACCYSCGHKELDTTEQLNWTELMFYSSLALQKNSVESIKNSQILFPHSYPP